MGPVAQSPVPLGEVFANKYRVDRVIGEGGMGVVVAAHHLELDQTVAIKFLLDDLATSEEGAERFRREARAAAKIQSDHVVRVLDVGILPTGERYMVMEYMEGRDLAEELAEKGTLPVGIATGIILEAIDAVGHAHAVGIVHRDLKPANLFLADRPDGSRRVKVLDFGISKSIGSTTTEEMSLTKTSAWIGSPLYMAPEQMQSARDVDHRADIWSLGAILYEMLAGRPPYEAESLPQLCNLLITTDPDRIETVMPGIPEGLAVAVMNCLVRDREKRTKSTRELARVLVNYASSITGSALRQSIYERAELQAGVPLSVAGTFASMGVPSAQPIEPKERKKSLNSTSSGWGATDIGSQKSKGGKIGWILAALILAGVAGYLTLSARMRAAAEAEASSPAVGVTASEAAATPELDKPAAPEKVEKTEDVEPPAKEEKAADTVASPPGEEVPSTTKAQASRPVAPRPVAPRPTAPRPTAPSGPGPAPQPASGDDFSDFGGRR